MANHNLRALYLFSTMLFHMAFYSRLITTLFSATNTSVTAKNESLLKYLFRFNATLQAASYY